MARLQQIVRERRIYDFTGMLTQIGVFFAKAGAFVFGSGLAIVPFLYGGVVKEYGWVNDQQFLDAVAVAMITLAVAMTTIGAASPRRGPLWMIRV